jgi:hypothetical protein
MSRVRFTVFRDVDYIVMRSTPFHFRATVTRITFAPARFHCYEVIKRIERLPAKRLPAQMYHADAPKQTWVNYV